MTSIYHPRMQHVTRNVLLLVSVCQGAEGKRMGKNKSKAIELYLVRGLFVHHASVATAAD